MVSFNDVWGRICGCAGQDFHTKTGLPFVYRIDGQSVVPDRTEYAIHESEFEKAYSLMPLQGPGQINQLVRGPAYVYAILSDPRMRGADLGACVSG